MRALRFFSSLRSDDARQLLKGLSDGDPEARVTQEAAAAFKRLQRLHASQGKPAATRAIQGMIRLFMGRLSFGEKEFPFRVIRSPGSRFLSAAGDAQSHSAAAGRTAEGRNRRAGERGAGETLG